MVAVGQQPALRQRMQAAMRKREETTAQTKRGDHGRVGDGAKRKDRTEPLRVRHLDIEKAAASRNLDRLRLVLRRDTTHRIGDARSAKHEAVIGTGIVDTFRKPEFP